MAKLKSLTELLEHYHSESMCHFGRSLYKWTSCGPWTAFRFETRPAYRRVAVFAVGLVARKLRVVAQLAGPNITDFPNTDDLELFGFQSEGSAIESEFEKHTLSAFRKLVNKFLARSELTPAGHIGDTGGDKHAKVLKADPRNGKADHSRIWIEITEGVPAEIKDIYYDTEAARTTPASEYSRCKGVQLGSIVEGSDVEIAPHTLLFPFTSKALEQAIADVSAEAAFYWNRDNLDTYLLDWAGKEYHFDTGLGADDTSNIPKRIRGVVSKFVQDHDLKPGETVAIHEINSKLTKIDKSGDIY